MNKLLLLLALFTAAAAAPEASAQFIQQRFLPTNGERGTLGAPQDFPMVQIDKNVLRLAPGARIYDQSNRTIVHGHIPSGAEILFAREQSGYINRIYILTEREIASLKQAKR